MASCPPCVRSNKDKHLRNLHIACIAADTLLAQLPALSSRILSLHFVICCCFRNPRPEFLFWQRRYCGVCLNCFHFFLTFSLFLYCFVRLVSMSFSCLFTSFFIPFGIIIPVLKSVAKHFYRFQFLLGWSFHPPVAVRKYLFLPFSFVSELTDSRTLDKVYSTNISFSPSLFSLFLQSFIVSKMQIPPPPRMENDRRDRPL